MRSLCATHFCPVLYSNRPSGGDLHIQGDQRFGMWVPLLPSLISPALSPTGRLCCLHLCCALLSCFVFVDQQIRPRIDADILQLSRFICATAAPLRLLCAARRHRPLRPARFYRTVRAPRSSERAKTDKVRWLSRSERRDHGREDNRHIARQCGQPILQQTRMRYRSRVGSSSKCKTKWLRPHLAAASIAGKLLTAQLAQWFRVARHSVER
jgi:hypothetical protein